MTLYRNFFVGLFLTLDSLSRENFKVKNVVPPAEGDLHLEGVWTMGAWMGFVALYHLGTGVPMGMRILTLFFVLTLFPPFILYRGTCICVTINGVCNIY